MTECSYQSRVVAIVHLGRRGGMGAMRRVSGIRQVFEAAGFEVQELLLRTDYKPRSSDVSLRRVSSLIRGHIVPESLSWSVARVVDDLEKIDPSIVILETARAYDPQLTSSEWLTVLDYVDRLSASYADRAHLSHGVFNKLAFYLLSVSMKRFERHSTSLNVKRVAVGWDDCKALQAEWVPMTIDRKVSHLRAHDDDMRKFDLVFFGNLSYPPNVDAVERLERVWTVLKRHRPETTVLIAGTNPTAKVRQIALLNGWTIWESFPDVSTMLATAGVSVVPLTYASGMQTKVLDAATAGVPQILSPLATKGFKPGLPAMVANSDEEFVVKILDLLGNEERRLKLGAEAKDHVISEYSVEGWVRWVSELETEIALEP